MFKLFKKTNKNHNRFVQALFCELACIDVTDFNADSIEEPLGFIYSGDVFVLENGKVEIYSDYKQNKMCESFFLKDVHSYFYFDHTLEKPGFRVIKEDKMINFFFSSDESPARLQQALETLNVKGDNNDIKKA